MTNTLYNCFIDQSDFNFNLQLQILRLLQYQILYFIILFYPKNKINTYFNKDVFLRPHFCIYSYPFSSLIFDDFSLVSLMAMYYVAPSLMVQNKQKCRDHKTSFWVRVPIVTLSKNWSKWVLFHSKNFIYLSFKTNIILWFTKSLYVFRYSDNSLK